MCILVLLGGKNEKLRRNPSFWFYLNEKRVKKTIFIFIYLSYFLYSDGAYEEVNDLPNLTRYDSNSIMLERLNQSKLEKSAGDNLHAS